MTPEQWISAVAGGGTPDIDACIDAFGDRLPLLERFASTHQDTGWHAEGDVRIHTGMVLDELYADLERAPVSPDERVVLVLGALLHDIAKPLTTRTADIQGRERVVAPRHEAMGRSWLAPRLLGLGLPWGSVREVLGIVGSHHEPKLLVTRDLPEGTWRRVALGVPPERVARVELADMRGRWCDDKAKQVEIVELFGLYAEEMGVSGWEAQWRAFFTDAFGRLSPSARDRAFGEALRGALDGRWRTPDGALWLGHAGPPQPPELVVMVGPSGAGKSTFAKRVLHDHEVVSLDELREEIAGDSADQAANGQVRQAARERLKAALRAGRKVVWDATSLRRDFRNPILQLGFDYGALVTLVVFLDSPEAWARRNRARSTAIPQAVLDEQIHRMELPDRHEAHRVLVLGEGGVLAADGFLGEVPYRIGE